ncbi:MAG TPA: 3-deoxy-manno-octulosonate cytidylyltransferase [Candidatus Omnitrophota bacterium]|nr:3-deoxy-manno-octulosonate cytidylyltransferase [Candidatus Omnitrophota bacterium]HPS19843.1 3-deoxy-manno-octulosonate cytidylyltransferase [Candidatus Omnitrophota bacterium]
MKCVAVIPARWQSSRFKGKVLAEINGKPIIQHVWERIKKCQRVDDVLVAVDKEKVFKAVESFGGKAVYTSPEHASGSDRIAEVMKSVSADIVVNVQGDEPLVQPSMIDDLVRVFEYEKNIQMATVIKRVNKKSDIDDPNVVKVVVDCRGFALYFSRSPIPHIRADVRSAITSEEELCGRYFKHIGLYAYTRDFLLTFTNLPKSSIEQDEKLEQLRALAHGFKIKTVETRFDTVGVDTPEDLENVRVLMTAANNNG